MKQDKVKIGSVDIPVIYENGICYYPISHLTTKVLLRPDKNGLINKTNKSKYEDFIKDYVVNFGEGNTQKCRCISEEWLKIILSKTQVVRRTDEQIIAQNYLHSHLDIPLLPNERDTKVYKNEWLKEHDAYTSEIIEYEINNIDDLIFRPCSKCTKYHPLTSTFYRLDARCELGFVAMCRVCEGHRKIFKHFDTVKDQAMEESFELYEAINLEYVEKVYQAFIDWKITSIPDSFINKECFFKIIDYLENNNKIDRHNFNYTDMIKSNRLLKFQNIIRPSDVYIHFFGDDFYYYPWKYPKFTFSDIKLTDEIANKVLLNYIDEFNIDFSDPLKVDYYQLLKSARIARLYNDSLYFAVKFNDFKYAGYKFKTANSTYYKDDNNILFDLKYLIEEDMKIEINKIPLYLTKNVLQKKCSSLYNQIVAKKNHSIYYWVDQLYPDKFIETDFDINPYRSEFDSDMESFIHDILKEELTSVIYNPRNSDHTIVIGGKVPDWLAFTDNGVYIVEYFGMYIERQKDNSRIKMYKKKMDSKIEVYKGLTGYKFLFLYPEDTEHDFKGVKDKIIQMKNDSNFTML